MSRNRTAALLAVVALSACGGGEGGAIRDGSDGPDAEARIAAAAEAWAALDPVGAARAADEALRLGGGAQAAEIAARAHLALGRAPSAVRALEGADNPELLRLRARAQLAANDVEGAAATLRAARTRAREEDPWTEAVLPAMEATLERGAAYTLQGESARLPLEEAALPVVRVRVDAIETLALIGSGSQLVVLDPGVRNAPGAIDELRLGEMRVGNVPHIVRSLQTVRETIGVDVGMVIGADLLRRMHAVLDGPGGELRLTRERAAPAHNASRARALMLSGSFLTVVARLGSATAWLTLDTAGLFTIALTPGTDEALGIPQDEWQASEAGPAIWPAPSVRIGTLRVDGVPLIRGLLDEAHARVVAGPVSGSVGWALLGQLVTRFDRDALYFE